MKFLHSEVAAFCEGSGRAVWADAQFVFRGHVNASLMSLGDT